jgi:hypothetical protein
MKKLIAVFFVVLAAISLAACKAEPSYSYGYGITYGLVHGHYVGIGEVVLDENDVVVAARLEEVQLPYVAAQVSLTEEQIATLPADVVRVVTTRGTGTSRTVSTLYYVKYFSVNGVLFTGTVSGEVPTVENTAPSQKITFAASGIADIEEWVKVEANAKAYVEGVIAGTVFPATAAGAKTAYPAGNASFRLGWFKSSSNYWPSSATVHLGWNGNMRAIEAAVVGTTMGVDPETFTTVVANGKTWWQVGDLVTGATASDFADYYVLLQQAYDNAVAGKK